MSVTDGGLSEGALLLGGLALAGIFLLIAFLIFEFIRDLSKTDVEREKDIEKAGRGQATDRQSFRGWAVLGLILCCAVMYHVHHVSTRPVITPEEVPLHRRVVNDEGLQAGLLDDFR